MIRFENIFLAHNGIQLIHDMSFTVKRKEKVVITGKSGTGKSSLLAMLLGFIVPDKGDIYFNNICLNEKTVWDMRKKFAYVDQDVSIKNGTAQEWIDRVANLKANEHIEMRMGKIHELCDCFHCDYEILEKEVNELSGGERQRLAIIIAILLQRNIFLFDEITAALDKELKKRVADYFIENDDWTVIAVSHDVEWTAHSKVRIFNIEERAWAPSI